MPDPTQDALSETVLSALWDRLEMANEMATSAEVLSRLAEVARLCDEAALLARSGELLFGADP
jgi:hypothetical protein